MQITLDESMINKITEFLDSLLAIEYKSKAILATFKLFKLSAIEAINKIKNIPFDEISTYPIIEELIEYISHQPNFLKHFKRWEVSQRNGEFYSHTLFEVLSVLFTIGYQYTLLTNTYSNEWRRCKDAVKKAWTSAKAFGDRVTNLEGLVDFANSFQPKKINQYIAKTFLNVGISLYSIKGLFMDGMTRMKRNTIDAISLPPLLFKLSA